MERSKHLAEAVFFEVWMSPGGRVWVGTDQEEAVLAGLQHRTEGVVTEVFQGMGQVLTRRVAVWTD